MFIQTIRKTGAFNVKNLGADNSPNNTCISYDSKASHFNKKIKTRRSNAKKICLFVHGTLDHFLRQSFCRVFSGRAVQRLSRGKTVLNKRSYPMHLYDFQYHAMKLSMYNL